MPGNDSILYFRTSKNLLVKTTFDSNRGKFDLFFNNWLKGNLVAIVFLFLFFGLIELSRVLAHDATGLVLMLVGCAYFFWKFYIRWTIRQAANINNIISSLSIDGS